MSMEMKIPKDWKHCLLNEAAKVVFSNVDKKNYEGQKEVLLCNYMDVFYNKQITSKLDFMKATASETEIAKFHLNKGDVVFTKDSETAEEIGVCSLVAETIPNLICGYHLGIAKPNPEICCGDYLSLILNFHPVHFQFVQAANGVTRFGLTLESISNIKIPLPPLPEQRKIAAILRTWDEGAEKADAIAATYRAQKRGLMQQLLSGQVRVKGEG